MLREKYGQLLRSLRKDHQDRPGEHWSQVDMADAWTRELIKLVQQSDGLALKDEKVVSDLECGRRGLRKPEELVAYLRALELTSGERREFLLASCGVERSMIGREDQNPIDIRNSLLQRKTEAPAYILDQYCDVIAANEAVLVLLDLEGELSPTRMYQKYSRFGYNMLQYVFSPEGRTHFLDRMQMDFGDWEKWAYQNMMIFRTSTLRYRVDPYYEDLFECLCQHPEFFGHWSTMYHYERDNFINIEDIHMKAPSGVDLVFSSFFVPTVTSRGELNYCTYVPTTSETRDYFGQLLNQTSVEMIPLAPWPEKD